MFVKTGQAGIAKRQEILDRDFGQDDRMGSGFFVII
jgi:hypothetical protein